MNQHVMQLSNSPWMCAPSPFLMLISSAASLTQALVASFLHLWNHMGCMYTWASLCSYFSVLEYPLFRVYVVAATSVSTKSAKITFIHMLKIKVRYFNQVMHDRMRLVMIYIRLFLKCLALYMMMSSVINYYV